MPDWSLVVLGVVAYLLIALPLPMALPVFPAIVLLVAAVAEVVVERCVLDRDHRHTIHRRTVRRDRQRVAGWYRCGLLRSVYAPVDAPLRFHAHNTAHFFLERVGTVRALWRWAARSASVPRPRGVFHLAPWPRKEARLRHTLDDAERRSTDWLKDYDETRVLLVSRARD